MGSNVSSLSVLVFLVLIALLEQQWFVKHDNDAQKNILSKSNGELSVGSAYISGRCTPKNGTQHSRRVLFTGCGYSGTGFLSKIFNAAGYHIGHECLDTDGVADWRRAFEPFPPSTLCFCFIFVQTRHPLSVVLSWMGTRWNFRIPSTYNCSTSKHLTSQPSEIEQEYGPEINIQAYMINEVRGVWDTLDGPIKALAWWTQANRLSLKRTNAWWRLEDFDAEMALLVCKTVGFHGCREVDWNKVIAIHEHHNSHKPLQQSIISWSHICTGAGELERRICFDAKMLCTELGYDNCK